MRAIVLMLVGVAVACGGGDPAPVVQDTGPSDVATYTLTKEKATELIVSRCTRCHTDSAVRKAKLTAGEWRVRIDACKNKPDGALIGQADRNALADYLALNAGKK